MAKRLYTYDVNRFGHVTIRMEDASRCDVYLQSSDDTTVFLRDVLHDRVKQTNKLVNHVAGDYFPDTCCDKHRR